MEFKVRGDGGRREGGRREGYPIHMRDIFLVQRGMRAMEFKVRWEEGATLDGRSQGLKYLRALQTIPFNAKPRSVRSQQLESKQLLLCPQKWAGHYEANLVPVSHMTGSTRFSCYWVGALWVSYSV